MFKVGDKVVFSFRFLSSQYYGTVISVDEDVRTCAVEYTVVEKDGEIDIWTDEKEHFENLRKLTKLERALR